MKHQEKNGVGVTLKAIDIIKSTIDFPANFSDLKEEFVYGVNVESTANLEDKTIRSVVNIDIKKEGDNQVLGSLTTGCKYEVTRFDQIFRINEKSNVKIPLPIIDFIDPISISTSRGIMFAMFKGTFLHKALLPIIDPLQFKNRLA